MRAYFVLRIALFVLCLWHGSAAFAQDAARNLPPGALAGFGRLPFHNGSRIHASELSPDGKLLATLSSRSATVWDTATGLPRYRFFYDVPAWPGYRRGIAFSPDGKRFACGPDNESVFVYDLASGKELRRFATEFEMFGFSFLRFTADSAALIVESNDVVSWFNVETGATIRKLPFGRITQLSPDDKTFVIVWESNRQVQIGDVATGKIKHTLPIATRFDLSVQGTLFLLDGVTLAAVHYPDDSAKKQEVPEVQFWDFMTGKRRAMTWPLHKYDRQKDYHRLALSPDGKVLYNGLRRFGLTAGKELPQIEKGGWTKGVLPHPDGKTLFVIGLEEIRRWDLAADKQISKDTDFFDWRTSAVSPDGRWLALRGYQYHDGFLELCDTEAHKSKRLAWPCGNGATIAFTADSRALAVNDYYHLQFLSVPGLAETKKLVPAAKYDIAEAALHLSADARHLAIVRDTGLLRFYDLATDKEIWSLAETSRARFTPDGKRLLAASRKDGKLRLHDLATKKILFEVEPPQDRGGRRAAWISAWAFDPSGRFLAVAMTGGHVMLLDAATGKERSRFLSIYTNEFFNGGQHYLHTTALAFSPDGQWLASGGGDGFLRIWDAHTRHELHRLHGHESDTQSLGFSADGRRLVSFGEGEGLVWDLRPQRPGKPAADPFADLLADDGPTVYRAIWALADDPRAPALLREKLPPVRFDARAERIAHLIADLDSARFPVRDAATRELSALEGRASPALLAALAAKPNLETQRRLRDLLDILDGGPTPTQLQAMRAVRAVDLHGSAAARRVLREWSEGTPGLCLTDAARAALARLPKEK